MAKRTALYEQHRALGAKLVDFGGFEMPVQYAGIVEEHHQVRKSVGIFDVSHMGEFRIQGEHAEKFLDRITVNAVNGLTPGRAQYTLMCYEDGGIVDDLLIYRYDDHFMAVVNAANIDKDWQWMNDHVQHGVTLENVSDDTTLLAVQGPESRQVMQRLVEEDLADLKFYRFLSTEVTGAPGTLSRTGYTGELGFEVYVENSSAIDLWNAILEAGSDFEIQPAGLGARDTLRLEAGLCLYGNDIDKTTNPIEARLEWVTKLDKGDFIGREAIRKVKEEGPTRKRVGFELLDRGIPRHDYPITFSDSEIGHVTSGTQSPTLGKGIGMGYVSKEYTNPGTTFNIGIRDRELPAKVVSLPFYSPSE